MSRRKWFLRGTFVLPCPDDFGSVFSCSPCQSAVEIPSAVSFSCNCLTSVAPFGSSIFECRCIPLLNLKFGCARFIGPWPAPVQRNAAWAAMFS